MTRKLPKIITQEDFEKLFKAEKDKRFKLAMLLGFEAGLRISEIVGLKDRVPALTKDMVSATSIRIESGKGGKDRIASRPRRLNEAARNMLPLKIPRRTLQDRFPKLAKKVLGKHITFHTLRHGFATHYYNKTQDILGLQQALGHSRTDTTSIYAHTNPEETIKKIKEVFWDEKRKCKSYNDSI